MRGHEEATASLAELDEVRARNRTFDGAYRRFALSNLGYTIIVLRLFDVRFYKIGILFFVLSVLLLGLAYVRARRSLHEIADDSLEKLRRQAIPTTGQEQARESGRPFITAGLDVVVVTAIVFAVETALLVLVLQI